MAPIGLAVAVWAGVCPAYEPGEAYPIPAVVGCPVPAPGLIYEHGHADEDLRLLSDLTEARTALGEAHAAMAEAEDQWSPAVWFCLGVAAGIGGLIAYEEGAE